MSLLWPVLLLVAILAVQTTSTASAPQYCLEGEFLDNGEMKAATLKAVLKRGNCSCAVEIECGTLERDDECKVLKGLTFSCVTTLMSPSFDRRKGLLQIIYKSQDKCRSAEKHECVNPHLLEVKNVYVGMIRQQQQNSTRMVRQQPYRKQIELWEAALYTLSYKHAGGTGLVTIETADHIWLPVVISLLAVLVCAGLLYYKPLLLLVQRKESDVSSDVEAQSPGP